MDFLNKTLAQLSDLFRSMTPGARITSGLLLLMVVISLGYLFTYHSSSPDVYLMNGEYFRPGDLPTMEAAFAQAKLSAYQFDGTRIRVPHGQQNAYMAALAEHNALPQDYSRIMDDTFKGLSPWSSKTLMEQQIKDGKRRMLEAIIREMKGIQNAFVQFDSEKTGGLNQEMLRTASVNVSTKGSDRLDESTVRAIRTLVAKSIVGLTAENIAVTDLTNNHTFAGGGSDGVAGVDNDPYATRKQLYENQYRDNILRALSYVQGATVVANVELDHERTHHKETVQHDPKPIAVQVNETSRTSTSEGAATGGRPGYAQQQPNAARTLPDTGKGARQEQEESKTETTNLVSSTHETTEDVGLTPKRVTVAIGVPASYFLKVWQERNPTAPGTQSKPPDQQALDQIRTEETKKIKDHVAKLLLPVSGVTDMGELVQVTAFQDLTPPPMTLPGMTENLQGWLVENWTTLGLIGLTLVGLMMLRSVVRTAPVAAPRLAAETAAHREEDEGEEIAAGAADGAAASSRLRRFSTTGKSLRDELSELVLEDPDAAANVLRAWIGSPLVTKS